MGTIKKKLDLTNDNNEDELQINKEFSERYERYRSKEVLQQLKDKYGDQIWESEASQSDDQENSEGDESDSSSEELDEAELFDEKFLRVLGALKTKDKAIYDQSSVFYSKDDVVDLDQKKELKKQAKKQLTDKAGKTEKLDLVGYHKKLIKEKKGLTAEDDELENQTEEPKTSLGYYEELKSIKQDLLKAAGDEDGEDDLIVGKRVLEPSDDEPKRNDPKTILETKSKEDKCIKKLSKYWKSDKLDKNEQFLRDFIIHKTYLSDDEEQEADQTEKDWSKQQQEEENRSEEEYDSDDSTHRKLVKTYESTRFHHEEPDAEKIKRFPRQIESIRDIALKKKKQEKRTEMKERKKQQKEAELRKLRELKRNEVRDKISLLEKTTGTKLGSKLKEVDIDMLVDDTEFDGEKYDQMIANLFNDEYYGVEENASEKPKFEYDSEVDEEKHYDELDQGLVADDDDYKGEIMEVGDEQDEDGINEFDEDELNEAAGASSSSGKLSKKKKLRLKKKEKLEQKKRDKSKGKNYGIYEDIIDGQGVRFKYRKTNAANYGLTEEEILLADEKELNRWCSLGKSQQYEDNEQDLEKYDRRGKNLELKKKILKSIYGSSDDESDRKQADKNAENDETSDNKRKKKQTRRKKSKKAKLTDGGEQAASE